MSVCAKHKKKPAIIYGQCVGCELDGLREENRRLKVEVKFIDELKLKLTEEQRLSEKRLNYIQELVTTINNQKGELK